MKVIIVGGVAGGASAAARIRRLNEAAEIIIFEKSKYVSYANCGLPYHIGDVIKSRDALLVTKKEMMERYRRKLNKIYFFECVCRSCIFNYIKAKCLMTVSTTSIS